MVDEAFPGFGRFLKPVNPAPKDFLEYPVGFQARRADSLVHRVGFLDLQPQPSRSVCWLAGWRAYWSVVGVCASALRSLVAVWASGLAHFRLHRQMKSMQ